MDLAYHHFVFTRTGKNTMSGGNDSVLHRPVEAPLMEDGELSAVFTIRNSSGIHVRPAGTIVKLFEGEECEATLTYLGKTVNARSVMSILMLGASYNGEVAVHIKGPSASRVMQKLSEVFNSGFGEL
ncbi:phosphocarrier protein HPr [Chlamydia trachomatis]|nr:Phosphocarrier protein HPr [Chlamydia trachomatis D-EC]ADI52025.1 Phosphocarrier protein HPr [Chlamydia trachomatis D-LC]AGT69882.1 phosphocarrier protein HPr [Chlamydia trachomatis]AGT70801.1 phosphocarrier protein HPr [Chlamydia trachomatis]AGT72643.1 phosphocarrier protein HPr [Chlamydia trachomatis]